MFDYIIPALNWECANDPEHELPGLVIKYDEVRVVCSEECADELTDRLTASL